MVQSSSKAAWPGPLFNYLDWPRVLLGVCLVFSIVSAFYASVFRFDASSETLVVEGDPDLALYERIADIFGGDEFLFLTFAPRNGQPVSASALIVLENITAALEQLEGVAGVFSILDAPLLKSPPMSLDELENGVRTLRSSDVDYELARQELTNSPFFKELLITKDGAASAIKINIAPDETLNQLFDKRQQMRSEENTSGETWLAINEEYRLSREAYLADRERLIGQIRQVQDEFSGEGTLHLGGVPMIAADMIAYVKRDLQVFGASVVGLMVLALLVFFRSIRWVLLPLATAALSVFFTVGLLGFLDWQATVVSSNFISLLGITTISLTIHLIVHYRELQHTQPELDRDELVRETMRDKFAPCFYTALTTIAAFGSLTASGIVPVEDFGWMMCMGICLSFLVTYTFFPAVLMLLPKPGLAKNVDSPNHFIRVLGEFTRWRPGAVVCIGLLLALVAVFGIQRVSLDNRFAEYFDPSTEIYQGMHFIDQNLGGTIPFDVVLSFPPYEVEEFDEDDDFGFAQEADPYPERYWFNRNMLDRLEKVHRFLDAQPHVGKVLSLTALEDFAREFTSGKKLTSLEIVAVLGAVPEDLRAELIQPYANPETGELRLSGRIIESGPMFDRETFRGEIKTFAANEANFEHDDVKVTGMMVLFNSMLNQLLDSQIGTLAYVLLAVFIMFMLLLRSIPHALLGMIPNTLAAASVISAMGYAGIPLDMMTTTIAAICIGIGVDDTIHYLHRFRLEYARWGDARVAVSFSHASIGRALYFTSVTVMVGFSVLYFSNFVPTVMFGIWTAVAMALALLANLALLPAMLVLTHAKRPPDPTVRTDLLRSQPH